MGTYGQCSGIAEAWISQKVVLEVCDTVTTRDPISNARFGFHSLGSLEAPNGGTWFDCEKRCWARVSLAELTHVLAIVLRRRDHVKTAKGVVRSRKSLTAAVAGETIVR
ncbi:hypothetical protein HGRIS_006792 [Hohenbuehelia grisea]|uniref:Uncharacterized protein n=1 Tax=Hohenbuehelia grisea TaxID=104357 RepID=A0ABR3JA12_9AGAR